MGEDACHIYRGDAAEILACIRHMALNMLKAETSRKASIKRKQKIAGMSNEYLEAQNSRSHPARHIQSLHYP